MDVPTIWISVMEAAVRLAVSHQTVRNCLAARRIRGQKFGPFQLVDARSVDRLAKERGRAR